MIVSAASDRISIFQSMIFFLVSRKFVTSKSIVAMDIVPPTIYGHKGGLFPRTSKYIQYVDKNMWLKKMIIHKVLWKKWA